MRMLRPRLAFTSKSFRFLSSFHGNANIEQKAAAILSNVVEPVTGRPLGSIGALQVNK